MKESTCKIKIKNESLQPHKNHCLINGAQTIAKGIIDSGCKFIFGYPMSPSTSVLIEIAKQSKKKHLCVEQTEDEISAINMSLGAWYAGEKAFLATSGGGFALMSEGLSLAGMTETPLVVMVGQRPGPATGLPARTEQGDLNLALYAGHGEFPRIIFSPGTLQEAYLLTAHSFNLADKYQVPVIILTDQYLLDTIRQTERFSQPKTNPKSYLVKYKKPYTHYQFAKEIISPRSIPGYGEGIACVDSNDDENSYITEDVNIRTKMQKKRLNKVNFLKNDYQYPTFSGDEHFKTLAICWGSTYYTVKNAINYLIEKEHLPIAMLHFSQVFPLLPLMLSTVEKAEQIITIENNYTGQFTKIFEATFNREVDEKILQYNGLPFAAENLVTKLKSSITERN